jgi:hypothetical protein
MQSAPTNLWEFLSSFDAGERFPLVVVMIMFGTMALVLIVAIIAFTTRSMCKHRLDDALKRELVDRGMNAEEIEQIVAARVGCRTIKNVAGFAAGAPQLH